MLLDQAVCEKRFAMRERVVRDSRIAVTRLECSGALTGLQGGGHAISVLGILVDAGMNGGNQRAGRAELAVSVQRDVRDQQDLQVDPGT